MSSDYPVNPPPATPPPNPPAPTPPPAAPPTQPAPAYLPIVESKSPALAGLLSMFPGLGHLYLGLYPRAFAFGGSFILAITLTNHGRGGPFFGMLIAFIWFFAIIDAVRQARCVNRGLIPVEKIGSTTAARRGEGMAALIWGVILVGLGTLWLIDRYVDMEWFWNLMDSWGGPAAIILLGLILIVTHLRKTRAENEQGVGMPPRSS